MTDSTHHNATLATRNPHWGFFGTIERAGESPAHAWKIASASILDATLGSEEGVRDFLDSRHGRHFADEVAGFIAAGMNIDAAIEAAIDRYQGWKIGQRTGAEHGIPAGLPYLTGWVAFHEIEADAA